MITIDIAAVVLFVLFTIFITGMMFWWRHMAKQTLKEYTACVFELGGERVRCADLVALSEYNESMLHGERAAHGTTSRKLHEANEVINHMAQMTSMHEETIRRLREKCSTFESVSVDTVKSRPGLNGMRADVRGRSQNRPNEVIMTFAIEVPRQEISVSLDKRRDLDLVSDDLKGRFKHLLYHKLFPAICLKVDEICEKQKTAREL